MTVHENEKDKRLPIPTSTQASMNPDENKNTSRIFCMAARAPRSKNVPSTFCTALYVYEFPRTADLVNVIGVRAFSFHPPKTQVQADLAHFVFFRRIHHFNISYHHVDRRLQRCVANNVTCHAMHSLAKLVAGCWLLGGSQYFI